MRKHTLFFLLILLIVSLVAVSCNQDAGDGVTCMVNGFVYDVETGLPIEGATVSIGTKKGVTDETGYFVVSGVGSGTYDVGIVAGGYLPGAVPEVMVNPGFFREVRGEDLVWYRNEIAANGSGNETRITTSGVYTVQQNGNVVTIRNEDAAQEGVIDSIGDATRYSQTIMGVALRPTGGTLSGSVVGVSAYEGEEASFLPLYDVPAGTGITAYYVPVSFIEGPHPADESILLALVENIETANDVVSFRTTVAADGSFTFTNVPNGLFFIVVDPFKVQGEFTLIDVPQTVCLREKYDERLAGDFGRIFTSVASGSGEAGELMAIVEEVEDEDLELLAIRAVDRSDLPIEAERSIKVPTGGGVALFFNKTLDEHYEGMSFDFAQGVYDEDEEEWDWGDPIPGTQFYIDNMYELGLSIVYVWNDLFNKYQIPEFAQDFGFAVLYDVSSFDEDDTLQGYHLVDNVYHMDLVSTNLYGESYYEVLQDGQFDPDNNILIRFDQIVPEGAFAEINFYYEVEEAGDPDPVIVQKEVSFDWFIDGDVLVIDPDALLAYDQEYFLSFKIFSEDGVVLYSTIGSLKDAAARGIVKRGGMLNDCIDFKTAKHQEFDIYSVPGEQQGQVEYLTNLILAYDEEDDVYEGQTLAFDPYSNISIVFTAPVSMVLGDLKWVNSQNEEEWVSVPVDITINDSIVTISLTDDRVMFPFMKFYLDIAVFDDELQYVEITNEIIPAIAIGDEIQDIHNGLESFKVFDPTGTKKFDSKDENITFEWESLGIHFGKEGIYWIIRVDEDMKIDLGGWLDSENEKTRIGYEYYKEFLDPVFNAIYVGTDVGDDLDALAFGQKCGYILVSFDEYGRLVQSPVIWIKDEVAPTLIADSAAPLLPAGNYTKESQPVVFALTAQSGELLLSESSMVTPTGIEAEKVKITSYVAYLLGETQVLVTVEFLDTVTLEDGDDLTIEIAVKDTSGNLSEKFTVVPEANP